MTRAYVGLGANLGDRERTLRAAADALAAEEGIEVVSISTLRETEPVGVGEQPRFLNGAAELETATTSIPSAAPSASTAARSVRSRSPRFAPSPTKARVTVS